MKIPFYLFFIFSFSYSFFFSSSFAQTITTLQGNVRDKNNSSLVIEDANVRGVDLGTGNQLFSTSTDFNGNYSTEFTDVVDDWFGPSDFGLSQNYPNPFNPSTKFNFSAPSYGSYTLGIFDAKGSLLFGKTFELYSGNYVFDVSGLGAAGVKFYRITGKERSETKGMIQLDGTDFNPQVSVSGGSFEGLSKISDNLEMHLIASKDGYFSDSVDVSFVPEGLMFRILSLVRFLSMFLMPSLKCII